jgi:cell pole-organizing protein PopZ
MSEQTSQEPTMEEILASIRRIISEDDAPPADGEEAAPAAAEPVAAAAEPAPEPEPEPEPLALEPEPVAVAAVAEPEPAPPVEEEALELTEKVETHGDLDVFPATAPEPVAAPELRPAVENLVGERAASAAASSFGALSAAILMPKGDRTLEDVVRELLRPMLQQWLDDNLPAIVQQAVETEVDRIARGRVR